MPAPVIIAWKYAKMGCCCDYCQDDNARLETPVFAAGIRSVVAPLFCSVCKARFLRHVADADENDSPTTIIAMMLHSENLIR